MWRILKSLLANFGEDRRGAVALLFGLTFIPMVVGVGLGIDYARAQSLKKQLGHALDAAALAVGSWQGLSGTEVEQKAKDFFNANFEPKYGTSGEISVIVNGSIIEISVTGHVDTAIMGIVGIDRIDVAAKTEVTIAEKKIELVMALDNTGSMGSNGKISALRTAAQLMVDILFEGEAEPDFVKVGLVPFAAAVNIGVDKLGSGWLDTTAQSAIASEDFQPGVNVLDLYGEITNRSWNGCVRARIAPFDTQDLAPSPGTSATLWAPYFAPDAPDFSWYPNRYAADGAFGGDPDDYDARQRFAGKYTALTLPDWENDGPNFNCWSQPLTPLTNVKTTLDTAIAAMSAAGSTVIPAGLAWGWRVISPTIPFTEGVAYDDEDTIKAIVLLTDGRNDVGGGLGNHNRSYYNAYGFAQTGHLGAADGSQAGQVLNAKTAALCTAIKGTDTQLYTITFQLADGPIKDLMRDCATKPAMYYDSPSNSELQSVFEDIAKGLNKLRLSK